MSSPLVSTKIADAWLVATKVTERNGASAMEMCRLAHGPYCDGPSPPICNGPVDWSSKIIRVICHSSSEAVLAAECFLGKRAACGTCIRSKTFGVVTFVVLINQL